MQEMLTTILNTEWQNQPKSCAT